MRYMKFDDEMLSTVDAVLNEIADLFGRRLDSAVDADTADREVMAQGFAFRAISYAIMSACVTDKKDRSNFMESADEFGKHLSQHLPMMSDRFGHSN